MLSVEPLRVAILFRLSLLLLGVSWPVVSSVVLPFSSLNFNAFGAFVPGALVCF